MVAAYAGNHTLGLWDAATRQRVSQFPLPAPAPRPKKASGGALTHAQRMHMKSAAMSPDGRKLAVEMTDGTTALYELATQKLLRTFGRPRSAPLKLRREGVIFTDEPGSCFAFAPDGKLLARGGFDQVVRVWDVQTGDERATFKGHNGGVTALAFSPDGRRLASASADSTALIWDVSKLKR
jgi:WD40 repeat protein